MVRFVEEEEVDEFEEGESAHIACEAKCLDEKTRKEGRRCEEGVE